MRFTFHVPPKRTLATVEGNITAIAGSRASRDSLHPRHAWRSGIAIRTGLRRVVLIALVLGARLRAQGSAVPEPTDTTRKHIVARRATGRIVIDGRMGEADWIAAPVARDFAEVYPDYRPTTRFPTEVRFLYDNDNLYVLGFNRDSAGHSSVRVPDLRRDFFPPDNDFFQVTLGPLGDRRTAFQFFVSPLGSQSDVQSFDGGDAANFNWDAMWRTRTTRADSGWIAELAIPWRSLRFARGQSSWDLNVVRNTRRVAAFTAWMPYPRQFTARRLTYAGVLDSLLPPPPRINLRMRPYALGSAQRDRTPGSSNASAGALGGELIWAPTANSLVEATVNTDFAQADVDRQVVNLTRFGVFFPERRQFFLDNADLLNAGGLGSGSPFVVQPFFSRRIGLSEDGTLLRIDGGARVAYRTARTTAGALLIRQAGRGERDAATFGVARGSQFFGRATRVGATVAVRQGATAAASNFVTAVDALARIGETVQFTGMLSTSTRDDTTGVAMTWTAARTTARSSVGLSGAWVAQRYAPLTGFVSRPDVFMLNTSVSRIMQPTWRPKALVWFQPSMTSAVFYSPESFTLQESTTQIRGDFLLRNSAVVAPVIDIDQQRPQTALALFPTASVPAGSYQTARVGLEASSDQSARLAGTASLSAGRFFDGGLQRAALSARFSPTAYVALRANYEMNRINNFGARDTSFVTHLIAPELRISANPRVQWSGFYQYNTLQERGTLNARFSWEFAPLSFLYVVYNDRHAIQTGTTPQARSVIVKLSWLRQL
jgi:hypothetical protein